MTRAEFKAKQEAMQRITRNDSLWALLVMALVFAVVIWVGQSQTIMPPRFRGAILGFCLLGGFYGTLAVLIIRTSRLGKKFGCSCLNCRRRIGGISARIVLASGRCGHCGAVVLEDWDK